MNQPLDLLDLSIRLTPPPPGSPLEVIASFALSCDEPLNLSQGDALLTNPVSEQERNELRWYLEDYWKWPFEGFARRGKEVEDLLVAIGKRLYHAVFEDAQMVELVQAWRLQPQVSRQISIISAIPSVLSLPWELLHDERGFLALRTRNPVSILRRLPQKLLAEFSTPFEPPLRVLLVTARPTGTGFLDPRGVARELLDEVDSQVKAGAIELEFLRPPTLAALRQRLKDATRPVHLLHFDGHGVFEGEIESRDGVSKRGGGQGKLAFETAEGTLDLVEADKLAQVLQDSGVRLAVLDACQSAMGSADDAFSSVATRLIQGGVDTVIAMSASVLVTATTRYFEAFYRELAAGIATPTAQERARQALYDDPRRHLMHRRRDEESQPVELQDWWLPHFYQQRPVILRATRPSGALELPQAASEPLSDSMPAEPRYGFSGRSYELLQIERYLLRGQLVVIHGFGGVGKTALVRETADWLTRTRMYDVACFVSFEHGGEASTLLSALGTFLGVYDGSYNPADSKAALAKLEPALKQQRTLIIADNLESILPGGEAPLDTALRTTLWDVLLKLSQIGAGVLLTSRDTAFGDGRIAPGKAVAYLSLAGLHPDDAYTLASRLLEYLGIDRAKAPYDKLRDLLHQLDYHPLAIQLVLPALATSSLTLAQIAADFASLLPRFQDDLETGRNRSLLASLEYSLRRLSQAQRDLLPRLALFEGGASEDDLLVITEIPESEWILLRPALEQAALLTAEQVEGIAIPFLHFHPVLAPYLRSQSGTDDPALHTRYKQRYYGLAHYLYDEDVKHPQAVRALVQKELPNLRYALELLLEAGELDAASEMNYRIARFLDIFGLLHELDEQRRRVSEVMAAKGMQESGELTYAEWLRESGLGEDEFRRGKRQAAYTRFKSLLARIERLPNGKPLGSGSYEHCFTLVNLARCLKESGHPAAAEASLSSAITVIEALLQQRPEDQGYLRERGIVLGELADALKDRGKYSQAHDAYEEALKVAKQIGDLRNQGVVQAQLGALANMQRDYAEAQSRYEETLQLFQRLGEPATEAIAWHQLGTALQLQDNWSEAERCYRMSLSIKEKLGDVASAARTCNHLALLAEEVGRPIEAEGWYKRALELVEKINPGSPDQASYFNNLANLLVKEVQAGRSSTSRLTEAKRYAMQALVIKETLDLSENRWTILSILAEIADLEGYTEEAQDYRHREHKTFAAFEGNRYHIDQHVGPLIASIAAAALGDERARKDVEEVLPKVEENGWKIAAATQRIWAGERDWDDLSEGIDPNSALLILRVLETIAQPAGETASPTPEEVFAALPAAIREALEQGDEARLQQAFEALSAEEQQTVLEALQYLQELAEEDSVQGE